MATKTLVTLHALAAELAAQATAGWTAVAQDGYYIDTDGNGEISDRPWNPRAEPETKSTYVRFEYSDGVVNAVVALQVKEAGKHDRNIHRGRCVEGHTLVNGACYTRRGIDCESVALVDKAEDRYDHDYADVASMLAGELARCIETVARRRSAVPVPGTPFSRQPEWFREAEATLRKQRTVTLAPHGFGTGYTLSSRKVSRFSKRAPEALEQALGIAPVYLDTYDAD